MFGLLFFYIVLAVTGFIALRHMRYSTVVPGITMVWGAHIVFFGIGTFAVLTEGDSIMRYSLGNGQHVPVSWDQYGSACALAAIGLAAIFAGYCLIPNHIKTFAPFRWVDNRLNNDQAIRRWAYVSFALALLPYLVLSGGNLLDVVRFFALGRGGSLEDSSLAYLHGAGSAASFLTVFKFLSYLGAGITAYLFWRGRRDPVLLALTAFFVLLQFMTGSRHMVVPYAIPFLLFARWLEHRKAFRVLLIAGIVGLPMVSAVQLFYRNIGFSEVRVAEALSKVDTTDALGSAELMHTAGAMQRYPNPDAYLNGQSYVALAVNTVPRAFWEDKPVGFGLVNAINLGYPGDSGTSISAGWMGEAWAQRGFLVVLTVGLLAGWLLRTLDNLASTAGPVVLALIIYTQARFAFWVRGDSVVSLGTAIFCIVLTLIALFVLGRFILPRQREAEFIDEAPAEHQPQQPQVPAHTVA